MFKSCVIFCFRWLSHKLDDSSFFNSVEDFIVVEKLLNKLFTQMKYLLTQIGQSG